MSRERHLLNCNYRPGLAFDPRCPMCRTQWEERSRRLGYTTVYDMTQILARPAVWDMLHQHERASIESLIKAKR